MPEVVYLPSAGKREQTKVQNRKAILDAAREVFGEMGYDTATVRDIIRRTGLAAGTFYNYFRSKDEVYVALSQAGARRFAPLLKEMRLASANWEQFVRAAIMAYFGFLADEHESWLARRPPPANAGQHGETGIATRASIGIHVHHHDSARFLIARKCRTPTEIAAKTVNNPKK